MDIAYSREAMHALLALDAAARERAIAAAEGLAAADGDPDTARLLPVAEANGIRLAPYSPSGDLVVASKDNTLIVLALIDVIGTLQEAVEQ